MKKVLALALALVLSFTLVGCGSATVLEDVEHDYYIAGQGFAWNPVAGYEMDAIDAEDERVASIADQLDGVEYLYIYKCVLADDGAEWSMNYIINDVNTTLNGNLSLKVMRTAADDADLVVDLWIPDPAAGELTNLTPDTLFIPEFIETATATDVVEDVTYSTGTWVDNPAALEGGSYYFVFAQFEEGGRALGLISLDD